MESTDQSSPAAQPAPDNELFPTGDTFDADELRRVLASGCERLRADANLLADVRDLVNENHRIISEYIEAAILSGHLDAEGKLEALRDLRDLRNQFRGLLGI